MNKDEKRELRRKRLMEKGGTTKVIEGQSPDHFNANLPMGSVF